MQLVRCGHAILGSKLHLRQESILGYDLYLQEQFPSSEGQGWVILQRRRIRCHSFTLISPPVISTIGEIFSEFQIDLTYRQDDKCVQTD